MNSNKIFTSFFMIVILIILKISNGESKKLKRMTEDDVKMEMNSEMSDSMFAESSCTREFKKNAQLLHREALCRMPRKMLIPIQMPSKYYNPGMIHRPRSYTIERCDGVCVNENHKCMPIEKVHVDVPVHMDSILQRFTVNAGRTLKGVPQEKCMYVKIEKHMRCACKCMMTEAHCNENQRFEEDRCACLCKDNSKSSSCAAIGKSWDQKTCKCECPPTVSRSCSTGAVFSHDTCRCMQISEMNVKE